MKTPAPPDQEEYIAISTANFSPEQILKFDLYRKIGGKMRLFRSRNYPLSQKDLENLVSSGCHRLFVPVSQKDPLYDYTRQRLPQLLTDQRIPLEEKLDILSETSVNILGRVLDNPLAPQEMKDVVGQCRNHVQMAFLGERACKSMVVTRAQAPFPIAHAISVANLSLVLGRRCAIDNAEQLHELGVGALLHDIGKTLIDRNYYYQPASKRLQSDPRVRQYPTVGRDLLERTNVIPQAALLPIAEHQERLDGSGFPYSLRNDQISRFGRIVAICDHYDEQVNGGEGQDQTTPFQTLDQMKDAHGKFDGEILTEFIGLLAEYSAN